MGIIATAVIDAITGWGTARSASNCGTVIRANAPYRPYGLVNPMISAGGKRLVRAMKTPLDPACLRPCVAFPKRIHWHARRCVQHAPPDGHDLLKQSHLQA